MEKVDPEHPIPENSNEELLPGDYGWYKVVGALNSVLSIHIHLV